MKFQKNIFILCGFLVLLAALLGVLGWSSGEIKSAQALAHQPIIKLKDFRKDLVRLQPGSIVQHMLNEGLTTYEMK